MEGNKHVGSSSSLTTQLFGSMDTSCSSTTGIFASIFPPPSKLKDCPDLEEHKLQVTGLSKKEEVLGRDSLLSQTKLERDYSVTEPWIPNAQDQDDTSNQGQKKSQDMKNKDMSSIYPDQRTQPCQFTSSIYYGGQDVYAHPQNSHNSGVNSIFKKDGGEDDSESASRGNWWQGSLYY